MRDLHALYEPLSEDFSAFYTQLHEFAAREKLSQTP